MTVDRNAISRAGAACAALAFVFTTAAGTVVEIPVGADTEAVLEAVERAGEGGTVRFPAGVWSVTNTLVLAKAVTVEGAGPDRTVLDFGDHCRGFELSSPGAAVSGLKIFRARACFENVNVLGGGVCVSEGTVTNCLIDTCSVGGSIGRMHFGGGVYMTGGKVVDCEITRCLFDNLYGFGNAVFMRGGTVSGCDIHGNDGGYSHPTVQYGGAVVYIENGTFEDSKVRHNVKDSNPGLHVNNQAVVRNCLVYGNRGVHGSGGIYMGAGFTGLVDHCTVCDNEMTEALGCVGLRCTGGTVRNSIFWRNGPSGCCQVASGSRATIVNNVLDRTLGDYPDNRVADPKFVDPGKGDFAIATRASPAFGYATPGAASDLAGRARSAAAPTCGAIEYDASDESFGADIVFSQTAYGVGSDVVVEAVVTGASAEDVALTWYVDERKRREHDARMTFSGLGAGRHSVGLKVSQKRGGELVIKDYTDSINVLPTECYVNMTGADVYPYDTPEKGTKSLESALDALWTSPNVTSVIHVAGGSYTLEDGVLLKEKVRIEGEGRDEVSVYCHGLRAFNVANEAALVRGVTVNGGQGAFEISAGRIDGCRATNVQTSRNNCSGAGFMVRGGLVTDCEAIGCSAHGVSGGGGGLCISNPGVVSNMLVRNCSGYDGKSGNGAVTGFGGRMFGVTVDQADMKVAWGAAVYGFWLELDSCVVTGCSGGVGNVVYLLDPVMRNCVVAGNTCTGTNLPSVVIIRGRCENCTFAENTSPYCCLEATNLVARGSIFAECGTAVNRFPGTPDVSRCHAPSLPEGAGDNVSAVPVFRDAAHGDFRLAPSSPCAGIGFGTK